MKVFRQISHTLLAAGVVRELERWIRVRDERSLRLFLGAADKLRLLKLRTWSFRYRVSVGDILDILVPVLRKNIKLKKRAGLGIRIATITGDAAEAILRDRLEEMYPDGANYSVWREQERENQLWTEKQEMLGGVEIRIPRRKTLLETGSVTKFVREYGRRLEKERESVAGNEWRKRKPYRGNPWR